MFLYTGAEWDQTTPPPHIIDQNNQMAASAFIPFCLYQSEFLANTSPLQNLSFPVCTSFKPTILEGQLCYKLDLQMHSRQGKKNELMLLLDYNNELSLQPNSGLSDIGRSKSIYLDTVDSDHYEAKIHINTLSQMTHFGGGSYKMTDVKRMTAKPDFLKMPFKDRNCEAEEYEACRTRKLLENCNCVPAEVNTVQVFHLSSCI